MTTTIAPPIRFSPAREAPDIELLTILMSGRSGRSAARRKAARLLSDLGGLPGLVRLGDGAQQLDELDALAAQRLAAAVELGLRCMEARRDCPDVIVSSEDVVTLLGPRLRHLMHEQVWMVGLDARNVVTSKRRIAEGGQHGCALLSRDVLRAAVQLGAHAFVLAHNHPGGDPRPSAEDVHLTEQLSAAACCVGVPLIDHVIITRNGHASLLKLGLIPDLASDAAARHARVAGGLPGCADRHHRRVSSGATR